MNKKTYKSARSHKKFPFLHPMHPHKPHMPHKPIHTRPRVPARCPEGFTRYTVRKGDTMFLIAQRIGVDLGLIIANNPHIPDPAVIFPGDILCVPIPISFPCRTELFPVPDTPPTQRADVLVEQLSNGQQRLSIRARNLVPPTVFGNFDAYEGFVEFSELGGFGFILTQTSSGMWEGTLTIPRRLFYAGAEVSVRPVNTQTGVSGQPILRRTLEQCARPIHHIPPKG